MEIRTEYGLINKLPDGLTMDDVPPKNLWLYREPFRICRQVISQKFNEMLLEELTRKAEVLNEERRQIDDGQKIDSDNLMLISGTTVVVCTRTVVYGEWKEIAK